MTPRQSRGGGERWVPQGVSKSGAPGGAEDSTGAGDDEPDTDEWVVPGAEKTEKPRRKSRRASKPTRSRTRKTTAPEPADAGERPETEKGGSAELSDLQERLAAAESRAAEADRRAEQAEGNLETEATRLRESSQGSEQALAELRQSHEAELAEVREAHEAELADLRETYERELAELRDSRERLEQRLAESESRADEPQPAAKHQVSTTQRAKSRVSSGERLDINTVGFEDLRELGMSVAQSARFIATRDVRMGFKSLKELDDLPDLPSDVVSTLKQRLKI